MPLTPKDQAAACNKCFSNPDLNAAIAMSDQGFQKGASKKDQCIGQDLSSINSRNSVKPNKLIKKKPDQESTLQNKFLNFQIKEEISKQNMQIPVGRVPRFGDVDKRSNGTRLLSHTH